jgi:hypothetical protein
MADLEQPVRGRIPSGIEMTDKALAGQFLDHLQVLPREIRNRHDAQQEEDVAFGRINSLGMFVVHLCHFWSAATAVMGRVAPCTTDSPTHLFIS